MPRAKNTNNTVTWKEYMAVGILIGVAVGLVLGIFFGDIHDFQKKEVCVPKTPNVYMPLKTGDPIVLVLDQTDPVQVQASTAIANYLNQKSQGGTS